MHCIGWLERFQPTDACLRVFVWGANRLRSVERRFALVRVPHRFRVHPPPASSMTLPNRVVAAILSGVETRFIDAVKRHGFRQLP